ncbi:hypothetical protein I551_4690 [Mycobacterium ulcerans str. Harvey]|uniref:Uncharacterized protein n=1 Tax=Mycobacterium ulcerans str. Harvey TaxID=1299332 RepID=A0ABN0QVI4_MYCUL|nr:hypothetical protein I551_4689 [Mycobacterium ulcerans str. Harvey]EUA88798.1 hypothetical protein I551_4690 [Mycobacterium ulcerans str. Harvey]
MAKRNRSPIARRRPATAAGQPARLNSAVVRAIGSELLSIRVDLD